ncbi:alpha/beta hydrolase [Ensifer adhaerens]|uniref:alpha/beta hydrolase n=1 Tax=Ensifer adhaerens TaxID=106592 RepID=UPI001CC079BB|nr:alpha/beta hydrolase [Ensifer adhaerens]MBZ7925104.1 alpha/beta hydrolase [Ensifer adhaerens]UAX95706.1 alpha/beta hydrolase [Ensifer adhaerens]UAY04953.1 alpha/beta hydrolase [Ensifer adhaerens]UAY10385.1 alpha/beta hydrolase [Ensifer adhaerens]
MTNSSSSERRKPSRHDAAIVFAFHNPAPGDPVGALIAATLPNARVFPFNRCAANADAANPPPIGDALGDMHAFAAAIEDLANDIAEMRRLYPDSVAYGIGYSSGATVLAGLLVKHPDLFDRAALLHPLVSWVPFGNAELEGKPILVTGGQDDPSRPLALTERLVDFLAEQKADVRALYNRGRHEVGREEMMALRELFQHPTGRSDAGRID